MDMHLSVQVPTGSTHLYGAQGTGSAPSEGTEALKSALHMAEPIAHSLSVQR